MRALAQHGGAGAEQFTTPRIDPARQRAKQQTEARYPAPSDAWYPAGFVQPYGVVSPPRGHIRFPMDSGILGALNEITVHERLLTAASQLLGNARHELR